MDARRKERIDSGRDHALAAPISGRPSGGGRHDVRESKPRNERRAQSHSEEIVVLIPVFNDWESLERLLPTLDGELARSGVTADVLVVDDGSVLEREGAEDSNAFEAIRRIDVLRLRRNLGHQRAIAIGLAYVEDCSSASAVVVMDGDGEDDPADVPRLLGRLRDEANRKIVFAERSRRSESIAFRIFYMCYKILHYLLTGKWVRVGNYSVIPRRRLSSLVVVAEMWNHYAAAVFRSRQPYCMIPTQRGKRLCGRSSMNFVALVTHGLSAISVYSDVVGVRLLVMSMLMAAVTAGGIVAAVIVRLATNWAVPGWASYTVGILLVLLVQAVMAAFVFSFAILGSRHGSTFLPRRDYSFFIGALWTLYGDEQSLEPLPVPELQGEFIESGISR
jgi:glycosyltransferase involved in cell wall biosynthesis